MSAPQIGDRVRVSELTGHVDSITGAYAELTLEDAGKHDLANLPLHVLSVIHPPVTVGYVIKTMEQLDALPIDAVVFSGSRWAWQRFEDGWEAVGTTSAVRPSFPVTVLYLPEAIA